MSGVTTLHTELIGPQRVRSTIHFTRTEMREAHARAMRQTALDLPSLKIEVWEGEDVVIIERNLV